MKAKKIAGKITIMIIFLLIIIGIGLYAYIPSIPEMFRLNKECQEQGYYMGDFEFKMMGFAYYLDKGHYVKAVTNLRSFFKQLKSRESLIKVPKFADKKQELNFYLNLQNPRTGTFCGFCKFTHYKNF